MQSLPLMIVFQKPFGPGSPGNKAPMPVTAIGGIFKSLLIDLQNSREPAWRVVEDARGHIDPVASCLLGASGDGRAFHNIEADLFYIARSTVGQKSVARPVIEGSDSRSAPDLVI